MPVARRATENVNTTWIPLPEVPLARFVLAKPALRFSTTFGSWSVNFGLLLHPDWRAKIVPTRTMPENTQQSDRAFYSPGLSLGFFRDGAYQSTNLIDFMTACFGTQGGKKFRKWVEAGGGPPRPLDRDDDKAEIAMINDWLGWMEGLECYGSIRHERDKQDPSQMRARFGGTMPIGSLPNEPEPDYQVLAEGKFRSMELETKTADEAFEAARTKRAKLPEAQPPQRWDAVGRVVGGEGGTGNDIAADDDMPF